MASFHHHLLKNYLWMRSGRICLYTVNNIVYVSAYYKDLVYINEVRQFYMLWFKLSIM